MDPVTIELVLKASKLVIESSKRDEILGRLNTIQSTLDQLILREIKSAYEAISDALVTNNEQTKNVRLNYAEESLLKNTSLDPALKTGEFYNAYLMALAHYGLAFVCVLRKDNQIAAKHLLRTYKFDPNISRTKLTPILFEEIFKPKCSNAAAVTSWVGMVAVGFAVPAARGAAMQANNVAGKLWNSSTPEHYRIGDMEDLEKELELKLDDRCREIALDFLSEK